jgi:PASTA domain
MTVNVEDQLRSVLEELASAAPLANPERPRTGPGKSARRRGPRADFKTLALVGCGLVLIGTLVAVEIEASHNAPSRPLPAVATTTLPPATPTSLPLSGPYVVPNVVGLTVLQAVGELQSAGLTNSLGSKCEGSFGESPVLSQNPPAGFHAAFDSRVNLRFSCDVTATSTTGHG